MIGSFEIDILDIPTRENLIAEIYYCNRMWVEISQETEDLLIQFYTYPNQEYWEFPFDLMMQILEKAKEGLLKIGKPDKTGIEALKSNVLMWMRNALKKICSLFVSIGVSLKLIENFKLVKTESETKKNIVKIYYNKILWAEMFKETEDLLIHFYPHPKKECMEFPIDFPIRILKTAKEIF